MRTISNIEKDIDKTIILFNTSKETLVVLEQKQVELTSNIKKVNEILSTCLSEITKLAKELADTKLDMLNKMTSIKSNIEEVNNLF